MSQQRLQDALVSLTLAERLLLAERQNVVLAAACKAAESMLTHHRVPQTIEDAGLQIFITMGPVLDQLRAALALTEPPRPPINEQVTCPACGAIQYRRPETEWRWNRCIVCGADLRLAEPKAADTTKETER